MLWDIEKEIEKWEDNLGEMIYINTVTFSPDGKHIVSGCDNGMIIIQDTETDNIIGSYYHGGDIHCVRFSPDGRRVISGSSNGTILIWDMNARVEVLTLKAEAEIEDLCISRDGKLIIAACYEDTIKIWDSGSNDKAMIAKYYRSRGQVYHNNTNYDLAISAFNRVNQLEPDNPHDLFQRGFAYFENRQYGKAFADFETAFQIEPNILSLITNGPGSMNDVAWPCSTSTVNNQRNGSLAVKFALRACELTNWEDKSYIDTLAAAYAEVGDFESAVKYQKQAISLPNEKNNSDRVMSGYKDRLKLYESGKPYRENP